MVERRARPVNCGFDPRPSTLDKYGQQATGQQGVGSTPTMPESQSG